MISKINLLFNVVSIHWIKARNGKLSYHSRHDTAQKYSRSKYFYVFTSFTDKHFYSSVTQPKTPDFNRTSIRRNESALSFLSSLFLFDSCWLSYFF